MRIRTVTVASAALLAAGLALVGCDPSTTAGGAAAPTTTASVAAASPSASARMVPSLVGLGLQQAQDTAQAAGFPDLTSHDASGGGRMQVLDRNWKVCDQSPAAGAPAADDARIDLGAVKLDESCPGDPSPATQAPATPSTSPASHAPAVQRTAAAGSGSSGGSGSSSGGTTTHRTEAPVAPGGGATARCNDGTLSYSQHHRGTCSHHGGVAVWYK